MNQNKLTEKAQEAIASGQRAAEQYRNTQFEPEHLLYALVTQEGGVVPAVLEKLGVSPSLLQQQMEAVFQSFPRAANPTQVYASTRFREIFEAAQQEAERLKDDYVSTEQILLALTDHAASGKAGLALRRRGGARGRRGRARRGGRGGRRGAGRGPE